MKRFPRLFRGAAFAVATFISLAGVASALVYPFGTYGAQWYYDTVAGILAPAVSVFSFGTVASGAPGTPVHLASAQTTAPALSSCGTTPSISGTDASGTVTMGTGTPTGCVITFQTAYVTAPHCTVTWRATPLASQSYAVTNTAITLTQTATSSNLVDYFCVAPSGG